MSSDDDVIYCAECYASSEDTFVHVEDELCIACREDKRRDER